MKLYHLVLDEATDKEKLGKIERMKQGPRNHITSSKRFVRTYNTFAAVPVKNVFLGISQKYFIEVVEKFEEGLLCNRKLPFPMSNQ